MKNISPSQKSLIRETLNLLKLLKPPPSLPVWAWGELRRRMGKNVTAKPGKYRVSFTPYQKKPQESFTDPTVQTTVLYWAKRLGKTEMINNLHGSVIEQSPRNILVVYPTLDSAKKWSKQFFMPMVRAISFFKRLIKEARTKDSNNTILAKEFPGGAISAIGANSVSGFRQVQAPVVTCDEIDAMDGTPEGDPVTLAFGRAENYKDSIQVVSSTATRLVVRPKDDELPKGGTGSRIHDWWLRSDRQKWFVPCGCGQWHVLMWSGVKWPEPHQHEDAWYETPCCGAKWSDYDRVKAILAGEWRATAPFRGISGYWLNGLNTVFPAKKGYKTKLHQMAAEFYDAHTGGAESIISWKNTFLCEPHEEEADRIDPTPLLERCETYTGATLPADVVVIGATVDVQGDRLEVEVVGLGDADETWGIEYRKIFGDPEKDAVWADLKTFLTRKFRRVDGIELRIAATAIDTGHKADRVRSFIRTSGLSRVYAVHGLGGKLKQVKLVTKQFDKDARMFYYSINTFVGKEGVFARLKIQDRGRGFMHFNSFYGAEYFDGLTAEEVRIKYVKGKPERYYEQIRDRNEPLDLRVYWLALVEILKPIIPKIKQNIKPPAPVEEPQAEPPKDYSLKPFEPEPKPKPQPKPLRPFRRQGGFVNGWK